VIFAEGIDRAGDMPHTIHPAPPFFELVLPTGKEEIRSGGVRASLKYLYLNELLLSIVQIGGIEGRKRSMQQKRMLQLEGGRTFLRSISQLL